MGIYDVYALAAYPLLDLKMNKKAGKSGLFNQLFEGSLYPGGTKDWPMYLAAFVTLKLSILPLNNEVLIISDPIIKSHAVEFDGATVVVADWRTPLIYMYVVPL